MKQSVVRLLMSVCLIMAVAPQSQPLQAASPRLETDVNLITAIDVSDSIMRHDEWLQYEGLARALTHPDFLDALQRGYHGRIGFAVFTWSSHGQLRTVVPWTVIASAADAARTAELLTKAPRIDRSHYELGPNEEGSGSGAAAANARTDLALAIDGAMRFSQQSPFPAPRTTLNILCNGVDNSGDWPNRARREALRSGLTINGVVFGGITRLQPFFAEHVAGGPGAFVMHVNRPRDLLPALERKFLQDLIAMDWGRPARSSADTGGHLQ